MMPVLTEHALEGCRVYTERTIARARYRIGNTWYDGTITRRERMEDGRVAVYIPILPQTESAVTVTGVELYDRNGVLWAAKTESIKVEGVQEGVLYRFTFDIREEELT